MGYYVEGEAECGPGDATGIPACDVVFVDEVYPDWDLYGIHSACDDLELVWVDAVYGEFSEEGRDSKEDDGREE